MMYVIHNTILNPGGKGKDKTKVNTNVCEQKFSWLNSNKQTKLMNSTQYMWFFTYYMDLHNLEMNNRLHKIDPRYEKPDTEQNNGLPPELQDSDDAASQKIGHQLHKTNRQNEHSKETNTKDLTNISPELADEEILVDT